MRMTEMTEDNCRMGDQKVMTNINGASIIFIKHPKSFPQIALPWTNFCYGVPVS